MRSYYEKHNKFAYVKPFYRGRHVYTDDMIDIYWSHVTRQLFYQFHHVVPTVFIEEKIDDFDVLTNFHSSRMLSN